MKIKTVRSSWWEGYGHRLDCQPYLAGALETKIILERLPMRKEALDTLTAGHDGGIYNGPKFSRTYVDSPKYGVPFVGSSAMLYAELTNLPYLSKKEAYSNKLRHLELKRGMTLISCSGTIGRTVYARTDMEGIWSSQHIMKVVANPKKILSGYLYAYLSSKFGVPLVVSGTYGSIIQSIEPQHLADLPVPRLDQKLEQRIHDLVERAAALRCAASSDIVSSRAKLIDFFGYPAVLEDRQQHPESAGIHLSNGVNLNRLDALFHNPTAIYLDDWIARHERGYAELGTVARVFDVPPFKHFYVESDYGLGFFTSADIFLIDKKPDKYLSKARTKGLQKYVLKKGWVLLARSGSLGGNIARPQFADSAMGGLTASDHVIRIASKTVDLSPGYIYAYLSTQEFGYPLILRTATGACVPAIWPCYLNSLKVLKPTKELNEELDEQVQHAFEKRVKATKLEDSARGLLERELEERSS